MAKVSAISGKSFMYSSYMYAMYAKNMQKRGQDIKNQGGSNVFYDLFPSWPENDLIQAREY